VLCTLRRREARDPTCVRPCWHGKRSLRLAQQSNTASEDPPTWDKTKVLQVQGTVEKNRNAQTLSVLFRWSMYLHLYTALDVANLLLCFAPDRVIDLLWILVDQWNETDVAGWFSADLSVGPFHDDVQPLKYDSHWDD